MAKNLRSQWIAKNLQRLLNAGLIILAAILVVFLVKETIHLGQMLFMNNQET
ncbi:phosphate-starvation-inducible protein PsiE, partial [Yersinia enterocolitica]